MNHLIIVCEGQTEQEFCKDLLRPHFSDSGTRVDYPMLKHSGGGDVRWTPLLKQVNGHLGESPHAVVTTFIDFYGRRHPELWPLAPGAARERDPRARVALLERGMLEAVADGVRHRFLPYIQLHEFEALLYSDVARLAAEAASPVEAAAEFEFDLAPHDDPELVNDNRETCPSRGIKRRILGYSKVVYGPLLCAEIGLPALRARCRSFGAWLERLEAR